MRSVDDRVALFLGCLLHDIGKGFGGDHSEKGAARAQRCVERLGLAPERVERVVFLVRHHLLMSHLALACPREIPITKAIGELKMAVITGKLE